MIQKKCTKCKEVKSVDDFSKDINKKDGLDIWCKKCKSDHKKEHHRTKEGLATQIFVHQRAKSKKRGHPLPSYSKEELKDWLFNHEDFPRLFSEWINSKFNKSHVPSIDRINDYLPYSFNNIKLTKWKNNEDRFHSDEKLGINRKRLISVVGIHKETGMIRTFYSIAQANRETGVTSSTIVNICKGRRNHNRLFNPYIWYYEEEYNKLKLE